MSIQQAYNQWAAQYDTNENKTRDLEKKVLRETLGKMDFRKVLEIGCGTGKNTEWLIEKADTITSVDFSAEMLAKAKAKIHSYKVKFKQADITRTWDFGEDDYDLVSFSLVLEHISDLDFIFSQTATALKRGGRVYIAELHPFKQYSGSKARFDIGEGEQQVVECYTHHVSEFTQAAKKHGLVVESLNEYFDGDDTSGIPRILCIVFTKA